MSKSKVNSLIVTTAASLALVSQPVLSDDDEKVERDENSAVNMILELADYMGGVENINAVNNQQVIANIQRYEPEQAFEPGGAAIHTTDIHRKLIRDINVPKFSVDWTVNSFYPTFDTFAFRETINGQQGAIIGKDGLFSPPSAPMRSTRVGTRTQQYFLSSPLSLVRWALDHSGELKYQGKEKVDGKKAFVVSMPGLGEPVSLFIDTKNGSLLKATTMEDDTVYGDALWEVAFSAWAKTENLVLPYAISHTLSNRALATELRSEIHFNVEVDDALYSIPEELSVPVNADQFAWGVRSSNWFTRYVALGIPFDIDQRVPELVNFTEIAPKVFHILGATHHSMLIEMNDHLIVVDPVLYDDRTQEIIRQITERWPTKPIRYVIASHFHSDHIGGVRGYGEVGATIIVGEGTEDHYDDIFEAPHTVYPDAFENHPVDVDIIPVKADEPFSLTDGERVIRIVDIENRHAKGMLVPYIEDSKMIFTSDLYNPGGGFGVPIAARFNLWAVDLLNALEKTDLDIEKIAGAHGNVTDYDTFVFEVNISR